VQTRLRSDETGQTLKEYALILGLIGVSVFLMIFFLGGEINSLFQRAGSSSVRATLASVDETLDEQPFATAQIDGMHSPRVGEIDEVKLTVRVLPEGTDGAGADGGSIQVSPRLVATLRGLAFNIEAVDPQLQTLSGRRPTTWRWVVEPRRSGEQLLRANVAAVLEVEGETTTRTIRTFSIPVAVSERPLRERFSDFVLDNWQFFFGVLLLPFALWGGKQLHSRWRKPPGGGSSGAPKAPKPPTTRKPRLPPAAPNADEAA
jgi:Flp pilus assembly pilin Flp